VYIAPSPFNEQLVFTLCKELKSDTLVTKCTLWCLPEFTTTSNGRLANHTDSMQELLTIESPNGNHFKTILFDPHREGRIAIVYENSIEVVNVKIEMDKAVLENQRQVFSSQGTIHAALWSPHGDEIAIGVTTDIQALDLRKFNTYFKRF
jgi:hypothetical protein